jgi:hypothetical protein
MSEVPEKGAKVEDADVSYLAARDDNVAQHAQRGGQGSIDAPPLRILYLVA